MKATPPKTQNTLPAFVLLLLAVALLLSATSCQSPRTVVQGDVQFADPTDPRPYTPFVLEERDGAMYWLEWDVWKIRDEYAVVVLPGDETRAMWVDALTGDTLATLRVCGADESVKYTRTLTLDGTAYEFGCPIDAVEVRRAFGTIAEP